MTPHPPRALRHEPLTLSDAPVVVTARSTLLRPIPAGAQVRLAADSLRSVLSGFEPERFGPAAGQERWLISGGRLPRPPLTSGVDRAPRQLLRATATTALEAGQEVQVEGTFYPPGAGKGPSLAPWADVALTFRVEVREGEGEPGGREGEGEPGRDAWRPAGDWFGFRLLPGPPERLEVLRRPDGTLAAGLYDRWHNPAGSPGAVQLRDLGDAGGRVEARDAAGRRAVSPPRPPRSPEGETLLFGEFHWHTEASGDGCRDVAASYRAARDGLFLDFAGAADHFPFQPPPSSRPDGLSLLECADIVDSFDAPGHFAALLGIELSWRMGHYNVYWAGREELARFVEAWERRRPGPLAGTVYAPDVAAFYGLDPAYFEGATPGRTLFIPHHTNVTSENVQTTNGLPVWTHYHWPLGHYDPRFLRLAEMVQGRGSFECEEPDGDWKVRHGAGGGSLRTGLARGFRVGFTGGTDNHSGWPSRQAGGGPVGLTAVYADDFSRDGIFRALYQRRCYATTGVRMVLDVRLNGAPMGSELALAPGDGRRLEVRVNGTAPLARAELVSQGAVVHRFAVDGPDLTAEWVDERRTRPRHDFYYYLRVRQEDGHCAWSSPIWGDLALPTAPGDGGRSLGGPVAWS